MLAITCKNLDTETRNRECKLSFVVTLQGIVLQVFGLFHQRFNKKDFSAVGYKVKGENSSVSRNEPHNNGEIIDSPYKIKMAHY